MTPPSWSQAAPTLTRTILRWIHIPFDTQVHFVACFPTEPVQDGGFGATEQTASAKMGNLCFQEILLQLCLLPVLHDHLYSHCILSAPKGKGRSSLFIHKAWMDGAEFESCGWLSSLSLPVSTALGVFGFVLQPSFPVEFTAGGFLWVSGLIIILLGGIYLIFAQVGASLAWFHWKTGEKGNYHWHRGSRICSPDMGMCRRGSCSGTLSGTGAA